MEPQRRTSFPDFGYRFLVIGDRSASREDQRLRHPFQRRHPGGLALADGDGTAVAQRETFDKDTTSYTASVAQGIDEITITPTATHSNATLKYFDADDMRIFDADENVDGDQVSLAKGANTINVEVTAEDEVTTGTYTVVVTRTVEIWVPLAGAWSRPG